MSTTADRLEFAPPATPGLIRALLLAVLAHALLLTGLTWSIQWKQDVQTASFEAELWSALPVEAAPPLSAKPAVALEPPVTVPEPAPPEPTPALPAAEPVPPPKLPEVDIAMQREKLRLQKQEEQRLEALQLEKLKQEKKLKIKQEKEQLKQEKLVQDKLRQEKLQQEKQKQAQADKTRQEALESKQAAQEARQLEAQREKNLARMADLAGLAGGSGTPGSSGSARKSAGPSAGYAGRIRARIKPNIVFTDDISGNPTAEVEVRTSPDGTIVGRKLLKSSGVPSWDESVLKAIDKTEVLPRDVDGTMPTSLLLVFRPKD